VAVSCPPPPPLPEYLAEPAAMTADEWLTEFDAVSTDMLRSFESLTKEQQDLLDTAPGR
jgi:hypothetical protein